MFMTFIVFGMSTGSECCFSQNEGFQQPVEGFTEKSETTNSNCEQPLFKPQNLYKQLWASVEEILWIWVYRTYIWHLRPYVVGSVWFLQEEGAQSVTGCDAGSVQERVVSAGCHTIRQTYTQEVWTEAWGYRLKNVYLCVNEWERWKLSCRNHR